MGAPPWGLGGYLPRRDGRPPVRRAGLWGRRPAAAVRWPAARRRRRPHRGRERLPDLGLRRRRLLRAARSRPPSSSSAGRSSAPSRRSWRWAAWASTRRPGCSGRTPMTGSATRLVLHYELFPYLSTAAAGPPPPPLAWDYPQDQRSWGSNYELMVDPDLLAAPVVGPGETPTVYLPPGSWVDLYTGSAIKGGGCAVHPRDAAHAVPALRARRRRRALQPPHADPLLVGRTSRPTPAAPASSPRTAPRSTSPASRTTCSSSSRRARHPGGHPRRQGCGLELERRAAPRGSCACTGPPCRARSASRRHKLS